MRVLMMIGLFKDLLERLEIGGPLGRDISTFRVRPSG